MSSSIPLSYCRNIYTIIMHSFQLRQQQPLKNCFQLSNLVHDPPCHSHLLQHKPLRQQNEIDTFNKKISITFCVVIIKMNKTKRV